MAVPHLIPKDTQCVRDPLEDFIYERKVEQYYDHVKLYGDIAANELHRNTLNKANFENPNDSLQSTLHAPLYGAAPTLYMMNGSNMFKVDRDLAGNFLQAATKLGSAAQQAGETFAQACSALHSIGSLKLPTVIVDSARSKCQNSSWVKNNNLFNNALRIYSKELQKASVQYQVENGIYREVLHIMEHLQFNKEYSETHTTSIEKFLILLQAYKHLNDENYSLHFTYKERRKNSKITFSIIVNDYPERQAVKYVHHLQRRIIKSKSKFKEMFLDIDEQVLSEKCFHHSPMVVGTSGEYLRDLKESVIFAHYKDVAFIKTNFRLCVKRKKATLWDRGETPELRGYHGFFGRGDRCNRKNGEVMVCTHPTDSVNNYNWEVVTNVKEIDIPYTEFD